MRRVFFSTLLLLTLMCIVLTASVSAAPPPNDKQLVGYFIEWGIYGRNYLVKDVMTSGSAARLTTINYAFANVVPNQEGQVVCQLGDEWADYQKPWEASQSVTGDAVAWPNPILGNFQQLKALKAMYPNLRVVISLGGWTWSKYFSDAALTPESRQAFVQSCVDLFIKGNLPDPGWGGMGGPGAAAGVFDGIDIDWEYPAAEGNPGNIIRPEDTQNFTALLAEFRAQLDAVKPGLLLTIAAPAGPEKAAKIEVKKIAAFVDWINLMTYDYHGPWDASTGFNSPLTASKKDPNQPSLSTAGTVNLYAQAGAPLNKLVVGVPFYGHGWSGVSDENYGLYEPAAGAAPGTWEAGTDDYKMLKRKLNEGFVRYADGLTHNAWLFDGTTFWTYDDPDVMAQKRAYVTAKGLRGVMFWELSGDTGNGELIASLAGD
ncbi:MAG: glycoside hydrolase family 18 protein [Rudaea sp.]